MKALQVTFYLLLLCFDEIFMLLYDDYMDFFVHVELQALDVGLKFILHSNCKYSNTNTLSIFSSRPDIKQF